jgi:POT family proton-dependent oligopeptide transporter
LGGYIADRYWGNRRSIIVGGIVMAIGQFLMFASACVVQQSIFTDPAAGGVISNQVNNGLALTLMFIGLGALIIGNGFFKPNISTMVGDLYAPQDHRKDSAFTIFYMGINTGALIAPLVCGSVASNGNWMNPGAFKWGFFCAGVAMILSVVVFMLGKKKYLNTPEGLAIGLPPSKSPLMHLKDLKEEQEHAAQHVEKVKNLANELWEYDH